MDTLHLLFNAVTVIFIAATMFTAGLGATVVACGVSSPRSRCWR